MFAPIFGSGPTAPLLDSDGRLHLMAVLHRGEDIGVFEGAVRAAIGGVEVVGSVVALHVGSEGSLPRLAMRATPADAAEAIRDLARFEAVFQVETWGEAMPALDESVWYTQTSVQPALAPPDGTAYRFDLTAKLFAHGLTGRGQVYAALDSGVENDDCHFRYGPNISDTTQFVPPSIQPPNTVPLGDPDHRAGNKIIAYYLINNGAICAPIPYDEVGHGTSTTACAVGDDFFVPAARAGESLDDPTDDEETNLASQLYALRIDHHQRADGMAPGAQVVFQDVTMGVPGGCGGLPLPLGDILEQAYDTFPGARVHNNSWGENPPLNVGYSSDMRDLDLASWRLRDMLVVFAAGNEGPAGTSLREEPQFKNGLTVGSTERGNAGPGGAPTTDIAYTSSHGPGWPDRIKPELAVPGQGIDMPRPFSNTPETGDGLGDDGCGEFQTQGGTSFAAPSVSGLALDVRQYFVDGYYPGGVAGSSAGFVPTNALLKGILVNSTRNLGGDHSADDGTGGAAAPRPTMGQGWGHPVLDDTLFFAGDPTLAFEGERSFLLVLNDVPNGVTGAVNDARPELLDSFRPAIQDLEVHSFTICVVNGLDLHATLVWSDVPGTLASGSGVHPLRNDLDLEIIDPLGRVWRPDPRTAVWSNGASVLAPPLQDSTGNGPDRLNANWAPGSGDSAVDDEDFLDADRSNPIENVFISRMNPDFVSGTWTLNVIGFDVQGNGEPATLASPNFVDSDGDLQFDTIIDTRQGYALVVSGMVATSRGIVHFDQGLYTCGQQATVLLSDCDGDLTSPLEVIVTTSLGDCDRFAVSGAPPFQATPSFMVRDSEAGVLPGSCDVASDGNVVVGEDGILRATYSDTSPAAHTATSVARMTCRDVRFVSVAVADACDATTSNGLLNRNEPATLLVTLENTGVAVGSLWGRLFPDDEDVLVPDGGIVIGGIQAGPGAQVIVPIPIFVEPDQECPSTLRFRLELFGTRGFRDRVYFDLPLAACALGTGPGLRPGEVPPVDVLDLNGDPLVRALRVAKTGPGQENLSLMWDRAANAERYDIWRGLVNALVPSGYTHAIPLGEAGSLCNILELDPTNDPLVRNQQVLLNEALDVDPDPPGKANFYYLVTAKATCPSGLVSLLGPVGHSNRDRDFVPNPEERRPAGLLLDPGCTP